MTAACDSDDNRLPDRPLDAELGAAESYPSDDSFSADDSLECDLPGSESSAGSTDGPVVTPESIVPESFRVSSDDLPATAAEPPAEAPPPDIAATSPVADKLGRCEERIGYVFGDKGLLRSALTHASIAEHRLASNERLEFLGDAILGVVVCELLFHKYPAFLEGELTRVKSVVVSRQTCAKLSGVLGLDEFMFVGKGMSSAGGVPQSVMADVFEALIAAMYLDGGKDVARDFIKKYVGPEVALAANGQAGDNYKSLLQQVAQRRFGATPYYQLLDERGPDHSKCFKVMAVLHTKSFPPAWGRNKKEAEQRAACNALSDLNGEAAPFPAE